MPIPKVTLNDETEHPILGFGTYKVGVIPPSATASGATPATVADAYTVVKAALEVGYRCLDCAQFYQNEKLVGDAIRDSGIPREQLYIISKVWPDKIYEGSEAVKAQFYQSLADLQLKYFDLYLIHWPVPTKHTGCWAVLEDLKRDGLVRSLGVSNYTIEDYLELKPHCTVFPCVNQIEINPFLYRKSTIEFFKNENIIMQAYRPLRNGTEMKNPVLTKIAADHARTVPQVLCRWCVQKGIICLPKSERRERMKENFEIFDFELSPEAMQVLDGLTTKENLEGFRTTYMKCVTRDTPLSGTMEGVKTIFTVD